MTNSKVLHEKLKDRKPQLNHLVYLDNILTNIDPIHFDKVMEIRNTIELTLLDNVDSENKIVSYLSSAKEKIANISDIRRESIKKSTNELLVA